MSFSRLGISFVDKPIHKMCIRARHASAYYRRSRFVVLYIYIGYGVPIHLKVKQTNSRHDEPYKLVSIP